jgi:Skp family chaperone for outer membrane proteins
VKKIAILVGVMSVGLSAYLASHLFAQTAPPAYPAGGGAAPAGVCTSKIAVINLQKVIKNYLKFKNIQAEMKKEAEGYAAQIDGFKAKIKQLETAGVGPTVTQEQRDRIAKDIKDLQRQAQDKSEEFNGMLQKHQFDQMVATYKDIQEAVAAFAKPRGIELIMHYQDGEGPEMYMPQFFSRRMSNGACQPVYMASGMDITDEVTNMLNRRINPGSAAAPAAPGAVNR